MILAFHSARTFPSIHALLIKLCSIIISSCSPFLLSSMGMLSMPGALLFLTDSIAVCMSNISGGSFFSTHSVSISFACALSREVLLSTVVAFRRS